ncbi:hypothetical protein ATK36_1247 [Amycolatopsis sulphurea]|uniref:Uncharacterized protein n=1 Tax=Amycolatopsis sulphurea TaxID=76022 RepID=A0A2A9G423_9PSEU|nr:hypothetical protein [Amycolatopsis sulphurea]PFG51078.1 hypothetical protein ATK36_6351 [Amycolatopsis sulphurea]PFG57651.1 hypothetical protein ATK36_1247 [Amycolatopsis sulphurea]
MTSPDPVPPPDAEIWHTAVATLEDGLGIYPLRSIDGVRYGGAGVTNTAVAATSTTVLLRVTQHRHGHPEVTELEMPPAFARYLAALLDSTARYLHTTPEGTR